MFHKSMPAEFSISSLKKCHNKVSISSSISHQMVHGLHNTDWCSFPYIDKCSIVEHVKGSSSLPCAKVKTTKKSHSPLSHSRQLIHQKSKSPTHYWSAQWKECPKPYVRHHDLLHFPTCPCLFLSPKWSPKGKSRKNNLGQCSNIILVTRTLNKPGELLKQIKSHSRHDFGTNINLLLLHTW